MSVITQIINGTNLNRDAGFSSLVSSFLKEGVRSNFGNDLAITLNQCDTGMAFVECTRTAVTPNEVFLVPVWVNVAETIDTSGDGYIIIEVDQAKINDGSANSADGTGIATVKKVSVLPSVNYIELASLASGAITDTRVAMNMDIEKMIAKEIITEDIDVDTISEKTTDNGVLIDDILLKDRFFDIEEITKPATPASTHWKLYFKNNGLHILDDAGNESKLEAGTPLEESVVIGETINGATLPVAVYQSTSDNKFYACDGNDSAKLEFLGFIISTGVADDTETFQHTGVVGGFTVLAEGERYYVQDDKTIGTTVGTNIILVGIAISETELLIIKEPNEKRVHASHITTVTKGTITETVDTVITCGFKPTVILLDFFLAGMSGGTEKQTIGHTKYEKTAIQGGIQLMKESIATLDLTNTTPQAGGNSTTSFRVAISILSISDTGYTVRLSYTLINGSPTAKQSKFSGTAFK